MTLQTFLFATFVVLAKSSNDRYAEKPEALECSDAFECRGKYMDVESLSCSGKYGCFGALRIESANNIDCSGYYSCCGAKSYAEGNVYCSGLFI